MKGRIRHIAFTAYPVKDISRARRFYEGALGLKMTKSFKDRWIEYHLGNGCFAVTTNATDLPDAALRGSSIAFEVDDVDALFDRLRARGVPVKAEPTTGTYCRNGLVADPDGNLVCLHQLHKKKASRKGA